MLSKIEKASVSANCQQLLLFPRKPQDLCKDMGLDWFTALKFYEDGWLEKSETWSVGSDNLQTIWERTRGFSRAREQGQQLKIESSPFNGLGSQRRCFVSVEELAVNQSLAVYRDVAKIIVTC